MQHWPDIIFVGDRSRASLSKAAGNGSIVRLGSGIYTGARVEAPEQVVRRNWREILGHELPGAILADRSARTTEPNDTGHLYVVHARQRPLPLPGLTIHPRPGATGIPGDTKVGDFVVSSPARGLLDNLAGRTERYLTIAEIERWIADILIVHGRDRLLSIRDDARAIAAPLDRAAALDRLEAMVDAVLAEAPGTGLKTEVLRAHAGGKPYDHRRIELFEALTTDLRDRAPEVLTALPAYAGRRATLPFYEAYFSNYIEGTEFTLDEAADIIAGRPPADRPDDAHDISGTYALTSDPAEMARVPRSSDELISILRTRHGVLLAGRKSMTPGEFKTRANEVAGIQFVAPELVEQTLRIGFQVASGVASPFARAAYMMFLVAEVHPFTDGNGRVGRLMMNSELVTAGEVRIVIPTVYRNNYLSALRGATVNSNFASLFAALDFVRRWTARIDFTDRTTAEADLVRTNALVEAREADEAGIRLLMP